MLHVISYQENHFIPTRIKKSDNNKCYVEKLEPLYIAGRNVESIVIWKTVWLKTKRVS